MTAVQYSVFDWRLAKYRVFSAPAKDDGLFDPHVVPLKTDKRFGVSPDKVAVSVPLGAHYEGTSDRAHGRIAVDATARAQAAAKLPEGLGSVGVNIGGVGTIEHPGNELKQQVASGVIGAAIGGLITKKWKGAAVGGFLGFLVPYIPRFISR